MMDKGNVIWEIQGKKLSPGRGELLLTVPVIVRAGKCSGDGAHDAKAVVSKDDKLQHYLSVR